MKGEKCEMAEEEVGKGNPPSEIVTGGGIHVCAQYAYIDVLL